MSVLSQAFAPTHGQVPFLVDGEVEVLFDIQIFGGQWPVKASIDPKSGSTTWSVYENRPDGIYVLREEGVGVEEWPIPPMELPTLAQSKPWMNKCSGPVVYTNNIGQVAHGTFVSKNLVWEDVYLYWLEVYKENYSGKIVNYNRLHCFDKLGEVWFIDLEWGLGEDVKLAARQS